MRLSLQPIRRFAHYVKLSSVYGLTAIVGLGLLIIEASWSHSDTPHSVGLFWTSDQPDAETSTWQHATLTTDIHASGRIRTRELPQTYVLYRVATEIGIWSYTASIFQLLLKKDVFVHLIVLMTLEEKPPSRIG